MIHLLRKEGKNRAHHLEPVIHWSHWQLELQLRREGDDFVLYVRNKTSQEDEKRIAEESHRIKELDRLFSVGPDRLLRLGTRKNNLHLTVILAKSIKRGRGDVTSLDTIVRERIAFSGNHSINQNDKVRDEVEKRFQGQNSKNLKKVQLKCEVFNLRDNTLIDTAISDVIRDTKSKDYGSLELKDVRPRVSCREGGQNILVVTEHNVKPGTVVPVFQLFDGDNRSLVEEQWLIQPKVLEEDERTISFLSPNQKNYDKWSHLTLKLKLRRKDDSDDSESISSCNFKYHQHESSQLQIQDQQSEEIFSVCFYCNNGLLDEDQTGLVKASLPQHSGPGLKRRKISCNATRNQIANNTPPPIANPISPPVIEEFLDLPGRLLPGNTVLQRSAASVEPLSARDSAMLLLLPTLFIYPVKLSQLVFFYGCLSWSLFAMIFQ